MTYFPGPQSTDIWNLHKFGIYFKKIIPLDLPNFIDLFFLPELYFLILKAYINTDSTLDND